MFRTECNKLVFYQGHWKLKACFIISNKTVLFCGNSNNWSEVQMKHKIQSDNSIKNENHMFWLCSLLKLSHCFQFWMAQGQRVFFQYHFDNYLKYTYIFLITINLFWNLSGFPTNFKMISSWSQHVFTKICCKRKLFLFCRNLSNHLIKW